MKKSYFNGLELRIFNTRSCFQQVFFGQSLNTTFLKKRCDNGFIGNYENKMR